MPNSSFPRWTQSGSWVAKGSTPQTSLFSPSGHLLSAHWGSLQQLYWVWGLCNPIGLWMSILSLLGALSAFFSQLLGDFLLYSFVFLYPSYFILSIHKQALYIHIWPFLYVLSCHILYLLTLDHGACFSVPHTIFSHELIFAGILPGWAC